MILRLMILVLSLCLFAAPQRGMADMALFSAQDGVAIGGYDPVAFFETGHAVQGSAEHALMWKGAVWRFSSAGNQMRFEMNPWAYAPMFGGYCAFAMAQGRLTTADPELWVIVEGELFLLNSPQVRARWQDEAEALIAEARAHWPQALRQ
ncbi:YHS domain-containing (seleno)protein [Phycobacter sp. K97]|uniref:YHS domain-containing (seleno)protein n=1 Tax=Phycobacter sedimenti TaxID=3133977 RepID=UPI00311D4150